MVLAAFLDESGSLNTTAFAMAGLMSTPGRWKRFARQWRNVLAEYGIKYFHMREFAHSRGEFSGWDSVRKDILMKRLVYVIKMNAIGAFGCVVRMDDYRDAFAGEVAESLGSPYHFCLRGCLMALLDLLKECPGSEQCDIFCDSTREFSSRAGRIYSQFKSTEILDDRERLGSLGFADDKVEVPLQAADLFAYEMHKFGCGYKRRSLMALDEIKGKYLFWTPDRLMEFAEKARPAIAAAKNGAAGE